MELKFSHSQSHSSITIETHLERHDLLALLIQYTIIAINIIIIHSLTHSGSKPMHEDELLVHRHGNDVRMDKGNTIRAHGPDNRRPCEDSLS